MHETGENQGTYLFFCFQHKSEVNLFMVLKSLNCFNIYLILIVICMFQNLPNVTHLSLMIIVFYIFKR